MTAYVNTRCGGVVLGHGVFWRGGRLNGEIAHGLLLGLVVGSISGGNQGAACVGEISLVSARLAVVGVGIGGHGMVWLEKATNEPKSGSASGADDDDDDDDDDVKFPARTDGSLACASDSQNTTSTSYLTS